MHYFRLNPKNVLWAVVMAWAFLAGTSNVGAHHSSIGSHLSSCLHTLRNVAKPTPPTADFKISIFRQYPAAQCTSGYLAVNDSIICHTLERPWQDNTPNISSIPAGTYPAILRYDHNDHWRIELQGTEPRTNVQIHIGNSPDQTKGCILVGQKLSPDLCKIVAGTSAPAYAMLKKAFYGTNNPTSTPNKTISVEIVGQQLAMPKSKAPKASASKK